MNSLSLTPPKVPLQNVNADFLKGFSCSSCSFDWSPTVYCFVQDCKIPATEQQKSEEEDEEY